MKITYKKILFQDMRLLNYCIQVKKIFNLRIYTDTESSG